MSFQMAVPEALSGDVWVFSHFIRYLRRVSEDISAKVLPQASTRPRLVTPRAEINDTYIQVVTNLACNFSYVTLSSKWNFQSLPDYEMYCQTQQRHHNLNVLLLRRKPEVTLPCDISNPILGERGTSKWDGQKYALMKIRKYYAYICI